MARFSLLFALLAVNLVSGAVIRRQGTQFITGPCQSDADCASACCGFNSGKCAGPVVAQERDGGCGFGDSKPNDIAAQKFRSQSAATPISTPPATPPANNGSGATATSGSGKPPGTQFITGACANDGECASGCCGFKSGKCAGPVVAQERDGGCGFGDSKPNDIAAQKFRSQSAVTPISTPPATSPANNGSGATGTVTGGSGKPPGTQFITGACANDGECASACCGFKSGKCAGPIVAQERDGGCGFGDPEPNDTAAQKLRGPSTATAPANPPATSPVNNGSGAAGTATSGSGKPPGTQFITGPCANDGECASGCCGFNSGKCAGPVIAQERDGGCGFGDAQPNKNAALKFLGEA